MMRATIAVMMTMLGLGCTVDAPEIQQNQVFFCRADSDCIAGYRCYQEIERCVDENFVIPDVVTSEVCSDNDGDGFFLEPGCGQLDCDDTNDQVYPGAPELCDGVIDHDCDKVEDRVDGFPNLGKDCFTGEGDCLSRGSFVCSEDGSATVCDAVPVTPVTEICDDNVDNDCDSKTDMQDEDCIRCTQDEACSFSNCDGPGNVSPENCPCNGFKDCSGGGAGVCLNEDGMPITAPFATQDFDGDGVDDDCDGLVDEDPPP